jgi:hypothetical protein
MSVSSQPVMKHLKNKQMKRLFIYFGVAFVLSQASCTKDFDELNTDPTKSSPANFDPNYFLSTSEWNYLDQTMGYNGPTLFQSGWVQIWASTSSGGANYYSNMDKYVASGSTNDYMGRSWNGCYRSASLAKEMVNLTDGDAELVNINAIGRIMIILNIQYITDMYGDCPYSEALMAKSGTTLPVYDDQQSLYKALLSDLDAALNSLDESKQIPSADLIYDGDIAKWRKFGYSIMLRMAMRLTKADLATAKTYAEKAAAGGTFASVDDDAYIVCDNANGYRNDYARDLTTAADYYQVRWSKTFIDYLNDNDDPRLGVIAEVPPAGLTANQTVGLAGDSDPDIQAGLPNGYDLNGGATDITTSPGYPGGTGAGADATPIGKYSRPRTTIYGNLNGPVFILTYAQTELLLAEAAVRGFTVTGSAATHYSNAVAGALLSLEPFGADATISTTVANNFAAASPLDESSTDASLKMINEQYWATCGSQLNFTDAWNNWKRSGYPVLTPVAYSGNFSSGTIPRRQPYPTTEATLNGVNYKTAVGRLSEGDTWASRIWWDQ